MSRRRSASSASASKQSSAAMSSALSRGALGETLRRTHIVRRVDRRQKPEMVVVDRRLEPRPLALGHLAAPVGRHRLEQPPHKVRVPLRHGVVHRHRTGQRRQPARFRGLQAQQRDDVARIGVEVLPLGGLVDADVRVPGRQAEVADMAEHMALRILRSGVAEIRADAPIGRGAFFDRPALNRQAAEQHEAAAVQHVIAQPVEDGAECRQREVGTRDRRDIAAEHTGSRRSRSRLSRWATADRSIRPGALARSAPIHADGPVTKGRRVCWSTALDIVPPVR